ncbi:hypothetical protein A9Q99_25220 [Gammaproteobacteria bacterium 45_16_T64]|nr:hypothetical protein A9Q99_25220 [Gammaproteobacteria bacterium 45_16_T64]
MNTPVTLLLEQGPMLKTLGRIAISTVLPSKKSANNPNSFPVISERVASPSTKLIEHYLRWAGVTGDRYKGHIPPHMFTQFAMPICSQQIEMTRYNIGGIINQGCGMTIYNSIPLGKDLQVDCEVVSVTEDNGRARLHQRLAVAAVGGEKAIDVDFYTAFIIGKGVKKAKEAPEPMEFSSQGSWSASSNDGLEFGILTGDLNPIHWIGPVAKMSAFKSKVLHGFGMFVRTFELIQQSSSEDIRSIDVKFISPVKLPSQGNEVFVTTATQPDGRHRLEQRDNKGKVQIVGSYC